MRRSTCWEPVLLALFDRIHKIFTYERSFGRERKTESIYNYLRLTLIKASWTRPVNILWPDEFHTLNEARSGQRIGLCVFCRVRTERRYSGRNYSSSNNRQWDRREEVEINFGDRPRQWMYVVKHGVSELAGGDENRFKRCFHVFHSL